MMTDSPESLSLGLHPTFKYTLSESSLQSHKEAFENLYLGEDPGVQTD